MKVNTYKTLKVALVTALLVPLLTLADTAPPSPVKVDTVTEMVLAATTDLMGTLHSKSHVKITAGVNGQLKWIVEPGTVVQQGDTLIKMDLLPLELQKAEQTTQIKRAKINVKYLKNEVSRLEKLRKTNATSQFQLDQTTSQYEIALADIEIAKLKLKQVEDLISRANVVAPFDGVITQRLARAGTDINRSDILLKLLDTERLEARLFVPIKYLGTVSKGLAINLSAHQQSILAPISAIIPSADPLSQTFEVRITVPDDKNEVWAAGQLVKVTVPTQENRASLTVHRDALILRKDGTYVMRVDNDNKAHRTLVDVGNGTATRVSVQGNLKHGDRVAIRGAERLNEGQEVVIQ